MTHAAIRVLAESGCLVGWCGEESVRFYAQGLGKTRSASNLMRQARLWANPQSSSWTLRQIRGKEGARVRDAYARASQETGVPWEGRSYRRDSWSRANPINRALSTANSCLYGVCHAAIVAAGYSTALGFIHTGKMLSFVYDIADLYKTEITVPAAFRAVADGTTNLETRVRHACRDAFNEMRLLDRVIPDVHQLFDIPLDEAECDYDVDDALPGGLWDPGENVVMGGQNFAEGGNGQGGSADS